MNFHFCLIDKHNIDSNVQLLFNKKIMKLEIKDDTAVTQEGRLTELNVTAWIPENLTLLTFFT